MPTRPMRPHLEAELQTHSQSLRALARLLVGEGAAEDLVQDTALVALQSAARPEGLRAWLARVLRRLASNHRRAESRRAQREALVPPPPPAASAARVAEHHEAVQRVTAALLALPEPYHGTLLLRFFEDLTPTQIAAATGVPLATVKSRLQRGLALLRERLGGADGTEGLEWRRGLTAAFGLPLAAPLAAPAGAASAVASVTTGVLLMGSGMKLLLGGAAAAAAAAAAFWFLQPAAPAAPQTPAPTGATAPALATAPANQPRNAAAAAAAAAADRREIPTNPNPSPAAGAAAGLRGRCVDEQHNPLANVVVRLTSNSRSSGDMDAWTRDHEIPKDLDDHQTTAADGTFAFHFHPTPPQQFWLWLQADGRATMTGHLSTLPDGQTKDLGDLVMPPGVLLRGRVVDADGVPVAKAEVAFDTDQPYAEISPRESANTLTEADGSFTTRWALLAGDYDIRVHPGSKPKPDRIHLDPGRALVDVQIVIERPHPNTLPPIHGVIVDEAGSAVPGAKVDMAGYMRLPSSRSATVTTTDADGRFTLQQQDGAPPEVSLLVQKEGFEELTSPSPIAWGRNDVRLALQRALSVEVTVVAADDGAPVEDFQLRVFRDPATHDILGGAQYNVRARGQHPNGRVAVAGIARGSWCVLVEPRGELLAMSQPVPVQVAGPGPAQVTVRLPRRVERLLRVQHPDGTPVVGTQVELADMRGQPAQPYASLFAVQSSLWAQPGCGIRLYGAVTDARGELALPGPAGVALAVFVRGPGHVPMLQDGIRLDDEAPLVVTVGSGARLTGKVAPLAALAELRRLAGLPEKGEVAGNRRSSLPTIRCGAIETAAIADDGSFALAGIPPGRWSVTVHWFEPIDDNPLRRSLTGKSATLISVDLRDGVTTEVLLDLSALLPGELDGLVLRNDKPAANCTVQVATVVGKSASGEDEHYSRYLTTDAEGRLHLRTRTGDYRLTLRTDRFFLHAAEHAFVVAEKTTAQTFHLQSGTLRLMLLDAQDQPVSGVRIDARPEDEDPDAGWTWLSRTDALGTTTFEAGPTTLRLELLPHRLQDPKAQQELVKQAVPDPFASLRLPLGEVTPKPGETTEVTLHLPADYDN